MIMDENYPRNVVIVGGSLGGINTARALRRAKYDGEIIFISGEEYLPYDRPPLSKQVLTGEWPPERVALVDDAMLEKLQLDLRLGVRATRLDRDSRSVSLSDGSNVLYDALVVATGASPRVLPNSTHLKGVHTLRTLNDAIAIKEEFEKSPKVVVVGAGFIGSEVAAAARKYGLDTTIVEALPQPLSSSVGEEVGAACAKLHEKNGVTLYCDSPVETFEGDSKVEGVRLKTGEIVSADVVVVGVGVVPETRWLSGSGLNIENGLLCDETCTAGDNIYAVGDVARWFNPLFGETMRIEHWTNAIDQARYVARNIASGDDEYEAFAPLPYVWSDQYETSIQYIGYASSYDEVKIVHGDLESLKFIALYRKNNRLVAALSFDQQQILGDFRQLITNQASWDEALENC
jgi:NADPH-dependent 2,4-dienoyl-CoA reductase/sulfur reductase-like enzyme